MLVVGITGGIGSGKTTVTDRFSALGITVVDSDIIAREIVEAGSPALQKIVRQFGEEILLANGNLDRTALRQIVFNNEKALAWLQDVTHPRIKQLSLERLHAATSSYAILSSPLLLEAKQSQWVNRICVVDVPEYLQRARASARDGSTAACIDKIIAKQIKREERLASADDVIDNSGSISATEAQVAHLHKQYLQQR